MEGERNLQVWSNPNMRLYSDTSPYEVSERSLDWERERDDRLVYLS